MAVIGGYSIIFMISYQFYQLVIAALPHMPHRTRRFQHPMHIKEICNSDSAHVTHPFSSHINPTKTNRWLSSFSSV